MRTLMCLVVGGLLLTLTACGKSDSKPATSTGGGGAPTEPSKPAAAEAPKPKDLIVGSWDLLDAPVKGTLDFGKDNSLTQTVEQGDKKMTAKGTYKLEGDDTLVTEVTPPGTDKKVTEKMKIVKLTKDELVTKDEKGKEDKFKKKM